MKTLSLAQMEFEITKNDNAYWDGYTAVFFKPQPNAFMKTTGQFRNGKWGVATKINISDNGTYRVPNRFVK